MPPLPDSLPLRPDSGPPRPRPPDPPEASPLQDKLARLFATMDARRAQREAGRRQAQGERLAQLERLLPTAHPITRAPTFTHHAQLQAGILKL